jgi:hypothetical protein
MKSLFKLCYEKHLVDNIPLCIFSSTLAEMALAQYDLPDNGNIEEAMALEGLPLGCTTVDSASVNSNNKAVEDQKSNIF